MTDLFDGKEIQLMLDQFHYILFGGDQLTVERATGSKQERNNESRDKERLEGLVTVVEDWHAKVCLLMYNDYTCNISMIHLTVHY